MSVRATTEQQPQAAPQQIESNFIATNLRWAVLTELIRTAADKGVFHLFAANVTIGVLAFGAQLFVVKFLTTTEMGYVKTLQSFMAVATLLAGFGYNTAIAKLCSERRSIEERAAIFRKCFGYAVIPILATVGAVYVIAQLGWFSPDPVINRWMPLYGLVIPGFVLTALAMIYLQATKRIKLMATTQTLTRLSGAALLVMAVVYFQFPGFVWATIAVNTLALLPLLWLLRSDLGSRSASRNVFWESFYYAKWGLAANVVQTVGANLDILLLNYLYPDRAVIGLYSIATIFLLGLNQITGTIQSIASPHFSEKSGERGEFVRVLRKYQTLLVAVAAAATVGSIVAVPWFVRVVYGDAYAPVGEFFRILSLKYFFWSCYALAGVAIFGLGKMRHYFLSVTLATVIGFNLTYVFITKWGPFGAAYAEAITSFATCLLVLLMLRHLLKHR